MPEIFIEESIDMQNPKEGKRKQIFVIFLCILSVILCLISFAFFSMIPAEDGNKNLTSIWVYVIYFIPVLLFGALAIYFFFKRNDFVNSYDYTFVSGSLRIARVLNYVKRVPLIKIEANEIMSIGLVDSQKFLRIQSGKIDKKIFATPNYKTSKRLMFIQARCGGDVKLIYVELSKNMILAISKFVTIGTIEKDIYDVL